MSGATQISLLGVGTRRKRGRARRPAAHDGNAYPWECTVLAVDTATRSGWAVRVCGKLRWSGEVDTHNTDELDDIIRLACDADQSVQRPLVLVLERPFPAGRARIAEALGAARERWAMAWERAGGARRDIVSVMPVQWRSRVLGRQSVRMKREEVRIYEMAAARQEVGGACEWMGADEAAAILISRWAARSPKVGAVLSARQRKRRKVRAA